MTIPVTNAVEGQPILAADLQQVFHHVNSSPGIAIFESNGTWSVPEGVHKFRVTLYAGGGGGYSETVGESVVDHWGGDGTRARCYFSGIDIGTTFTITIGAGGGDNLNGGSSSFGPSFICPGGQRGSDNLGYNLGGQAATFPAGTSGQRYVAPEYTFGPWQIMSQYMYMGSGGPNSGSPGRNGICVIEW